MTPNIGKPWRIIYIAIGAVLLFCQLLVPLPFWMRGGAIILGILSIIGAQVMTPNIGKPLRIVYVAIGVVLLVSPLYVQLQLWMRFAASILGIVSIITGATGW